MQSKMSSRKRAWFCDRSLICWWCIVQIRMTISLGNMVKYTIDRLRYNFHTVLRLHIVLSYYLLEHIDSTALGCVEIHVLHTQILRADQHWAKSALLLLSSHSPSRFHLDAVFIVHYAAWVYVCEVNECSRAEGTFAHLLIQECVVGCRSARFELSDKYTVVLCALPHHSHLIVEWVSE